MTEENGNININPEETLYSEFSLLELGKNLVKNTIKKSEETNLIIIGDKGSGKTSLFNNFLLNFTQKETYSATCGINYSYMRYQPSSTKKMILNVYEIGGGIANLSLIKTIINERNLKNTIFLLNLDFSHGNKLLKSLKDYLRELSVIVKDSFSTDILMEIIESKRFRYKDINSNDFKRINIFPLQLIVVGNKYDSLEKIDVDKIKWTCRTLRFFCHLNALSLLYFKSGDSKLSKVLNGLITNLAFNVNNDNSLNASQKNDILPLYIIHGNDTLNEIGDPKVIQQGGKDLTSLWEDTFSSVYPEESNDTKEDINKFEDMLKEKYKEPRIDEESIIFE